MNNPKTQLADLSANDAIKNVEQRIFATRKQIFQQSINTPQTNFFQAPERSRQQQHNCIFTICYNGEPRQFSLAGELIDKADEFDPIPPLA